MSSDLVETFLGRLDRVGRRRGGWIARCPAHADADPSLSVAVAEDGTVLTHCFAGCTRFAILSVLGLSEPDLHPNLGRRRRRRSPPTYLESASATPGRLTLEDLAAAKQLPTVLLRELGCRNAGTSGVAIPYFEDDGELAALRTRLALIGQRFRWRRGDHPLLYGLWRLDTIRQPGWVLLVEGESDCWTAWHHGLPALGIPGKTTWQSDWAKHLTGLDVVVWQEPDAEDLVSRMSADIPDARVIVAPPDTKDISEAHLRGEEIGALVDRLRTAAVPIGQRQAALRSDALQAAFNAAGPVLTAADPLDLVEAAIVRHGFGGDTTCPLIVYLAATTRLLPVRRGAMPAHALVLGSSSAGKNAALDAGLGSIPPEAIVRIDAGSPRVLIYDDRPLEHRVVVFAEADSLPAGEGNPAASAIRNLATDGHLHYDVTVRDPETGRFTIQRIDRTGPTVLFTTSTRPLGKQLMTRLFTIEVPDEVAQVRAALAAQANLELTGVTPVDPELVAFQSYLQTLAPIEVVVPFARELADRLGARAQGPRVLRDSPRLIALTKAVAIVRIAHRARDERGRLVATLDDYETVRGLVADLYEASAGASARVRQAVVAVEELTKAKGPGSSTSATEVARWLDISVPSAWRRLQTALAPGWLLNDETRPRQTAKLRVGEPLPPASALPTVDELSASRTSAPENAQTQAEHSPGITPHAAGRETRFASPQPDRSGVFTFSGQPGRSAPPTTPATWTLDDEYVVGTA